MIKDDSVFEYKYYQFADKNLWAGRKTQFSEGNQYWYQEIKLLHIDGLIEPFNKNTKPDIGILGYACDEGVRRNRGRVGAKMGPIAFRKKLAALAFHHKNTKVGDFGDVVCDDMAMENCQDTITAIVEKLLQQSIFPLLIGGGHDVAYGHFKGIKNALKSSSRKKLGIINFDAHFDLRPVETEPNSGTPFNQILRESENVDYLVVGLQEPSNTKSLYEIARSHNVEVIYSMDCFLHKLEEVKNAIQAFINKNDWIYLSIDLDAFSSAFAPGVSAPSPMGFSPIFALEIIKQIFDTKKVISCDIVELNPLLDVDNATSSLAARLADFIVSANNKG